MAVAGNNSNLPSWEQLLAAINPPQETPEELYARALDSIKADWQAGCITDEEADNLIKQLLAARIQYEMRGMISYAFSPAIGDRDEKSPRRRFSLL